MFKLVSLHFILIILSVRKMNGSETNQLGIPGDSHYSKLDPLNLTTLNGKTTFPYKPVGCQNETSILTGATSNQSSIIEACRSQIQTETEDPRQKFYVITAIFNPASFQRRYELYHEFVVHMEETGAQLITIECIFPSLGQNEFEITNPDNPNHIQIESKSVYWVKENLINIAVSRLPESAEWVAWIDADVVFQEADWVLHTIRALESYTVVQLFKYSHFLDENDEILLTEYSFGYAVATGKPIGHLNDKNPHPGYGWAMSKSTFKSIGGLPIYDIVGMGDLFFAYSLINHVDFIIEAELNHKHKISIFKEANHVFENLSSITRVEKKQGIVGFSPLILSHKWHGARKDRGYMERTRVLVHHNFNYWTHMKINKNGLLDFKADKHRSLETDIACYFESRNEDSAAKGSLSEKCDDYKAKYLKPESNTTQGFGYKGFDCIWNQFSFIESIFSLIITIVAILVNEKFTLKRTSQLILAASWLILAVKYQILHCYVK